ncbi:uncharacterized protein ACNLHF_016885 [Anomaloglossus baeobatrachus]|uniref:uncharacterized protein LOC142302706 n=1 Tax=Anomaloglossus baeobatrachus TaxID=238106 RepID=UPI003F4FACF8
MPYVQYNMKRNLQHRWEASEGSEIRFTSLSDLLKALNVGMFPSHQLLPPMEQVSSLVVLAAVTLDPPCIDGVPLIGEEREFYTLVSAELDHFLQQGNLKSVLLFPPVSSRLRFLIHRLTEPYGTLASFSVGEGWQRRTVICHSSIRIPQEEGETRTRPRDDNHGRFWSSHSPKGKWESGRGRQNWRQRKDRRPDREPYAARGKHGWRGRGGRWRVQVKDEGQMSAPDEGLCLDNGNGELLQSKKVPGAEMTPSREEMPEGQEVQCEGEEISGKLEDSERAIRDILVICQEHHEKKDEERRPGQVAAAADAAGQPDLDLRQDYVEEERAGGLSAKSVDDKVVSEKKGAERSESGPEETEIRSSVPKDLQEMKVVEQEDLEVKAEGHDENGRKEVAPAEAREQVTVPLVGQAQAEITVMVQGDTEMRADAHEANGRKEVSHEEAEMPAEPREEVTMPLVGQAQEEVTVMGQEEAEMRAEAHEANGRNAEAHEAAEMSAEPREEVTMPLVGQAQEEVTVMGQEEAEIRAEANGRNAELAHEEAEMPAEPREEVTMPLVGQAQEEAEMRAEANGRKEVAHEEAEMSAELREEVTMPLVGQAQEKITVMGQEEAEMRAEAHEENGRNGEAPEEAEMSAETQEKVGMPAEPTEQATIPVVGQEQAEMVQVDKEINVKVEEQAAIVMEHHEEPKSRAVPPVDEAEIVLQPSSNVESEKPSCTEESSENGVQDNKIELTMQGDEEQKMMEQLMAEIQSKVCEKDVHIQPLKGDFSEFAEVQVDRGRFGHIIEVYGFSSKLKAEDLMEPFKKYRDGGFWMEWVDNSHVLGIFSSPEEAYAASSQMHPDMKFRPLSQGSRQSKSRVYEKPALMQTHKERPRTDATVARRMVYQALAVPETTPDHAVAE